MSDFRIDGEGSIYILTPITESAREWCEEYLPDDALRWGARGYVVEHRYIEDIAGGILAEGLTVE